MPTGVYTRRVPSLPDLLWSRVDKDGPPHPTLPELGSCWLWTGPVEEFGYGTFRSRTYGRFLAHRLAWTLATEETAPPPILHTCDRPNCLRNDGEGWYVVNGISLPRRGHLFRGDRSVNAADKVTKGRQGARPRPGSAHHNAKVTEADIPTIIRMVAEGVPRQTVGDQFHISATMVGYIYNRKNWRHVTVDGATS